MQREENQVRAQDWASLCFTRTPEDTYDSNHLHTCVFLSLFRAAGGDSI